MIIIPAIDIKNGVVVRLTQGKFDQKTTYTRDAASMAKKWQEAGARLIHVIDLDGAEKGTSANFEVIKSILASVQIPLEVGGGIRSQETAERLLESGIQRIILGTTAVENLDLAKTLLAKWQDRILVSLDCANGKVATKGWTEISDVNAIDFAKELEALGLKTLIYTDIARDGALVGPNLKAIEEIAKAVSIDVIASGGISSLEDIKSIKALNIDNIIGIIVGKALYEDKFSLKEAIDLC